MGGRELRASGFQHAQLRAKLSSFAFSTISSTPCFTNGALPDLTMRTGSVEQCT